MEELRRLFPGSFGEQTAKIAKAAKAKDDQAHSNLVRRKKKFEMKFDPSTQRSSVPKIVTNFEKQANAKVNIVDMSAPGVLEAALSGEIAAPFDEDDHSGAHEQENGDALMADVETVVEENPYKLPITHEIVLRGHKRLVSALTIDPSGARVLSGSYDNEIRMWDFGGMDQKFRHFRKFEPSEGHAVMSVQWSRTGDRFLVCPGSAKAKIYDRDGYAIAETIKGDMYIRDMTHTFGHVNQLNGGIWHPSEKERFMTWSVDGTLRVWDTEKLKKNLNVVKLRNPAGGRHACTAACYSPDAKKIVGASLDGTIQMWDAKRPLRPKVAKKAHEKGTDTSCVLVASDNHSLYSRGGDNTVKVWDLRKFREPVKVFTDLPNENMHTELALSPDQRFVVTGTSAPKNAGIPGKLVFISRKEREIVHSSNICESSVVRVVWNAKINQIALGCADNNMRVLYNPKFSKKGALLCAGKKTQRMMRRIAGKNTIGQIVAPHWQRKMKAPLDKRKQKFLDRKDPVKSKRPELPINGPARDGRLGQQTFAEAIVMNAKMNTMRDQDPREALLRYSAKAKADPVFLGKAYAETQPVPIYDTNEYDDDGNLVEEPKKKRQRTAGM